MFCNTSKALLQLLNNNRIFCLDKELKKGRMLYIGNKYVININKKANAI